MGLEAVKEEILNSAKEQANSLIAEARREANRISRETEKKIEELQGKSEAETKRAIDIIKRQELASAELENKKMLLEAKKSVIESAFAEATTKLEALDDKKRESLMARLLEKARKDIDVAYVYCSKKDAKFLKNLNPEPAAIISGLIAEDREKIIRVDYSFETMLQGIKENELQSMSKILFG